MRPIDKGNAPQVFTNYQDAKPFLTNQLGTYCSYCERRIATNLAVEHILPKDINLPYAHLRNEWTNFLLGCVNCNSAKGTTVIGLDTYLLPDRDNTFACFDYDENGLVEIKPGLDAGIATMAENIRDVVALNRTEHQNWDDAVMFSALQRVTQRVQAFGQARDCREDFDLGEVNIRRVGAEAAATGFFSIWMTAFEGVREARAEIIRVFAHTSAACFDQNTDPVCPRPNNGLQNAGKS
jgi:hypothetical protein